MKLTLVLAVAVAALAGALIAVVVSGDDDDLESSRVVVQEQPAASDPLGSSVQPEQGTGATETAPQETVVEGLDADDQPIDRQERARVRDAAVRAAGGGEVTDIDRSDDLGVAFEVELVRDGREVDVRLDDNLDPVAAGFDD